MASGYGLTGNVGRCYGAWLDFSQCMVGADVPGDCLKLKEDYFECLLHRKEARPHCGICRFLSGEDAQLGLLPRLRRGVRRRRKTGGEKRPGGSDGRAAGGRGRVRVSASHCALVKPPAGIRAAEQRRDCRRRPRGASLVFPSWVPGGRGARPAQLSLIFCFLRFPASLPDRPPLLLPASLPLFLPLQPPRQPPRRKRG